MNETLNAITTISNASQLSSKINATPLGVNFSPDCSIEDWEAFGRTIGRSLKTAQFIIGDWLNFGRDKWCDKKLFSDRISIAVSSTGLDPKTLNNYASIARRVPIQSRRNDCTFDNHVAVAKLPVELQSKWLQIAVDNKMSKRRLTRSIIANRIISVEELIAKKREPAYESILTHSYAIERLWNELNATNLSIDTLLNIRDQLAPVYAVCRAVADAIQSKSVK